MNGSRRKFVKKIVSIGACGLMLSSGILHASLNSIKRIKENFSPESYENIIARLFNGSKFKRSHKIKFSRLPRVAENGAAVPLTVSSSIKNISKISILVDKNPHPLIAEFYLSDAVSAHVSARIKMAKTSSVIAIVEAEGILYRKTQKVKVTKGGCG